MGSGLSVKVTGTVQTVRRSSQSSNKTLTLIFVWSFRHPTIKLVKRVGETKKLFDKTFLIPVDGRISGVYGSQRILNSKPRSTHKGIDIAAPKGTKIYAPSTGRITLIDEDMFFTGKTVIIDHGMGLISIFAHLNDIYIRPGQLVEKGMEVGEVGMSGRATGPHLHWGVFLENISVDPMALLKFKFNN